MQEWARKKRNRMRRRWLQDVHKEEAAKEEVCKFDKEHFDDNLAWQLWLREQRLKQRPPASPARYPTGRPLCKRKRKRELGGGVASCDWSDPCDPESSYKDKCKRCRAKECAAAAIAAACAAVNHLSYST
tara:strand:- start:2399 stop:2788 length:390 start_codon:yes stop_codon:yes gene_type:complete